MWDKEIYMASYFKSEQTKANVINACKSLFYKNGYIKTHYNDIAQESGINSGLIYYHFKKKSSIAGIIQSELTSKIKEAVQVLLGENYDLQIATALEVLIFWDVVFHNENYRNFFYEISLDRTHVECSQSIVEEFFRMHNAKYGLGIDEGTIKIISLSSSAMESEIIIHYHTGLIDLSQEKISRFIIRTIYEYMSVDYRRIEDIVQQSSEIFSKLTVHMKDSFEIEIY
jgi:AcrR family transcriptional regulator